MTPTAILAIDPGFFQSAWLLYLDGRPAAFAIEPNVELLERLRRPGGFSGLPWNGTVVIEQVESFGMAVGREVFETVRWAGRFEEAASPHTVVLVPRRAVKLALCGSTKAKDANVRQALLDRFGGPSAVGTTKARGPLYGVSRDVWSALAVAVTYSETAA